MLGFLRAMKSYIYTYGSLVTGYIFLNLNYPLGFAIFVHYPEKLFGDFSKRLSGTAGANDIVGTTLSAIFI